MNNLYATNINLILSDLLDTEIIETPLGSGISVNPREGFLFSTFANGYYFENKIAPYKFILRTCNSALNFSFVNGIFDNYVLSNTPHLACKKRKYLNQGQKTIIPIEITEPNSLNEKLYSVFGESQDPNIILLPIDLTKKGHGLEPFMEYLFCKFFSRQGYITESQIPLSHSSGYPDIARFSLPEIQKTLLKQKIFSNGFFILELAMLRDFETVKNETVKLLEKDEFIVGDVKTSTTSMQKQIDKYLNTGYFDFAIECHPFKTSPSSAFKGIFNILNDKCNYSKPKQQKNFSDNDLKKAYRKWLISYLNIFLLANYNNDELNNLSRKLLTKTIQSREDLIKLITKFDLETHLKFLTQI